MYMSCDSCFKKHWVFNEKTDAYDITVPFQCKKMPSPPLFQTDKELDQYVLKMTSAAETENKTEEPKRTTSADKQEEKITSKHPTELTTETETEASSSNSCIVCLRILQTRWYFHASMLSCAKLVPTNSNRIQPTRCNAYNATVRLNMCWIERLQYQ